MLDVTTAEHQHALAQADDLGHVPLDAVDHDGARHAVERLPVALAVRMRVIPVEARRMIARDAHRILQRLPGHGHHVEHIVLGRHRRHVEPVEVQVRHVVARPLRAALAGDRRQMILVPYP